MKLIIKTKTKPKHKPDNGSLWMDEQNESTVHMLIYNAYDDNWLMLNIETGEASANENGSPFESPSEAVEHFYEIDAKTITIS